MDPVRVVHAVHDVVELVQGINQAVPLGQLEAGADPGERRLGHERQLAVNVPSGDRVGPADGRVRLRPGVHVEEPAGAEGEVDVALLEAPRAVHRCCLVPNLDG